MKKAIPHSLRRRGFALVIVLAMLVLILGLVMAYFSRATLQRQISSASASSAEADLLGQAAVGIVLDDVNQEILAGSQPEASGFINADVHVRRPLAVFNEALNAYVSPAIIPQRAGDEGIANIVKASRRNTPFFSVGPGYSGDSGASRASGISTDTPSLNGRRLTKQRWNQPRLMTQTELDDSFTVPDWIYLSRTGASPTQFDGSTLPGMRDKSRGNGAFVVGRFAYVIYDVGGLLDINVIGNSLGAVENATRGRLHQVSLENGIGNVSLPNFAKFVTWRWPLSASNDSNAEGGLFDPKRTFLKVEDKEQAFVGRQDLIDYAKPPESPIPETALPYLTAFSRSVNAPSHAPALDPEQIPPEPKPIPAAYFASGDTPQAELNPDLLGSTTRFTEDVVVNRPEGAVKLAAGTPLMFRRFPLGKLDLLKEANPDADELMYYFGLKKLSDGRFLYDARIDDRLATLEKVVAFRDGTILDPEGSGQMLPKAREPNFFEILQGVVSAGSLGKSASTPEFTAKLMGQTLTFDSHHRDNTEILAHAVDSLRNRQILQIGANIIDQWDEDDLPTTVWYPSAMDYPDKLNPDSNDERNFISVYGIENLPYMTQFIVKPFRPNYGFDGAGPRDCLQMWAIFDVWNPHQGAAIPQGITNFRIICPYGALSTSVTYVTRMTSTDQVFSPWSKLGIDGADMAPGALFAYAGETTTWSGGTSHAQLLLAGYDADGQPIPDPKKGVYKTVKDLNEEMNVQLTFPPAAYAEPTTVGSGEPTQASDIPGVLLDLHNFSKVPIETDPAISRPNPAIPQKFERPKNLQKTLNYYYDKFDMYPYTAKAADDSPIRRLDAGGNSVKVSALETQGAGDERIYPAGVKFTNLDTYAWSVSPDPATNPSSAITVYAKHGVKAHNYIRCRPLTSQTLSFDLQAEINGEWVTYQRIEGWYPMGNVFYYNYTSKATLMENTHHSMTGANLSGFYNWNFNYPGNAAGGPGYTKIDPRSVRFGVSYYGYNAGGSFLRRSATPWNGSTGQSLDWIIPNVGGFSEYIAGTNFKGSTAPAGYSPPVAAPGFEYFWKTLNKPIFYGLISNHPTLLDAEHPMRYADIDEVTRPADGYWGALPTVPGHMQDRPVILNRPFRSVGELGYVFRDTPWKTLDFSTGQSGDAGLLDVFSLDESESTTPVVAGKVNLNTRQAPVLATLLEGTAKQNGTAAISAAEAKILSEAIVAASKVAPFKERGDLISRVFDRQGVDDLLGDIRKTEREAAVRALSEAGETRTWNFLIDLIAQSGRLGPAADDGSKFVVQGEQRFWVHVAVDRLTGKILDIRKESVHE